MADERQESVADILKEMRSFPSGGVVEWGIAFCFQGLADRIEAAVKRERRCRGTARLRNALLTCYEKILQWREDEIAEAERERPQERSPGEVLMEIKDVLAEVLFPHATEGGEE